MKKIKNGQINFIYLMIIGIFHGELFGYERVLDI